MKNTNICLLVALGFAHMVATAQQQAWETVVDNPYPEAYSNSSIDLAAGSDGSIYHLVIVNLDGTSSGRYLPRSIDQGATWTIDPVPFELASEVAVDRNNNIYVAGARYDDGFWTVLKSSDHGANWTAIFEGNVPSFRGMYGINGLAVDDAGAVYVVGDAVMKVAKYEISRWVVRKGVPTSSGIYTWSDVDVYARETRDGSKACAIAIRSSASPAQPNEIYVAGDASGLWAIRRSMDGGATWTTVDSLSDQSTCWTIAVEPNGNIYAAGRVAEGAVNRPSKDRGTTYDIVRKGTPNTTMPNGLLWNEPARFAWTGDGFTSFADIAVDSLQRVFVAGAGQGPDGLPFGLRVWTSAGDNAPYYLTDWASDSVSRISVVADGFGNIFTSSAYWQPDTGRRAIRVRRLPAP